MRDHYGLTSGMRILDVGCGKGFLLHEFTRAIPGIEIQGIDISDYGIEHAKPEVSPFVSVGNAVDLPFDTDSFDFVVALGTLHNLYNYDLHKALQEIERVGRNAKYVMVEAYRSEREKANLVYWQLTCRAFHTPREWEWTFSRAGYTGDYGLYILRIVPCTYGEANTVSLPTVAAETLRPWRPDAEKSPDRRRRWTC